MEMQADEFAMKLRDIFMKKIKVLYILSRDEIGGAPKSTFKLLDILAQNDYIEPIIITPKRTVFNELASRNGYENYALKYNYNGTVSNPSIIRLLGKSLINWYLDCKSLAELNRKVDFNEVEVVHTSMSILELGLKISKKYNIPHIMHLREIPNEGWRYLSSKQYLKMNKYTDRFISISKFTEKNWIEFGLSNSKMSMIYNGIDPNEVVYVPSRKDIKKESIKLVFAGTIKPMKGQLEFINSFFEISEDLRKKIFVDFVGFIEDQEYVNEIKNRITLLNMEDNVNFLGYMEDLNKQIGNYDVGIMGSKAEAFGRVTIEYMMAGLCIIATDGGANRELIDEGKSGFLYSIGDYSRVANILKSMLLHEIDIKNIGKSAREYALQNFTADKNAENVYKEYLKILNGENL